MSMRWTVIALAFLLAPTAANAVEIYFNGVKVTGAIRSMDFENANLKFDAQGNLHIDAPGYEIQAPAAAAAPAASAPPPAARFWLVLDAPTPGQYKVSVKANGQPVVDVPPGSKQYVVELTGKLFAGANSVQVTFLPVLGAARVAPGTDAVSVMVGEGDQAVDGTLTIKRVLGTVKQPTGRTSAEAQAVNFQL